MQSFTLRKAVQNVKRFWYAPTNACQIRDEIDDTVIMSNVQTKSNGAVLVLGTIRIENIQKQI